MHYRLKQNISVILMSRRRDAPYRDRIEQDGSVVIYEGPNIPNKNGGPDPQTTDQPRKIPAGHYAKMVCLRKDFSISRETASPGTSLLSMKRFIEGFEHSTNSSSLRMCGNRRTAQGKFLNSNWNWLILWCG
jgi:hypothetical protein